MEGGKEGGRQKALLPHRKRMRAWKRLFVRSRVCRERGGKHVEGEEDEGSPRKVHCWM
jgi:hypothetical protein